MPFIPPESPFRSLTDVLAFIQGEDGCTRAEAFDQFRRMAALNVIRPLWSNQRPAPRSSGVTQAADHVGPYPGMWEVASIEGDDRVRFQGYGTRPIQVLWSYFLAMWWAHQPRSERATAVGVASMPTATGAPGRPSKGMHWIRAEFERRRGENACKRTLREEATELWQWFCSNYPKAPTPTIKTIENNLRSDYRQQVRSGRPT